MNRLTIKDRNAEMERLYKAGLTLQEIANKYGLTRERISQILGRPTKAVIHSEVDKA